MNDEWLRETEQEKCQESSRRLEGRSLEGTRQQTVNQLSGELGITMQRVREIETRAGDKLRKIAEAEKLDLVAISSTPHEFPPRANPARGFWCIPDSRKCS
jgi:DNA-directed RNA polymerase sigma subunit (sigma70/sigma32)